MAAELEVLIKQMSSSIGTTVPQIHRRMKFSFKAGLGNQISHLAMPSVLNLPTYTRPDNKTLLNADSTWRFSLQNWILKSHNSL